MDQEDDFEGWYVIRTKQHAERRVLEELDHLGVETYFPMLPTEVKRNRKTVTVDRPMLVRYMFVYIKLKPDFYHVKELREVERFLPPEGKPGRIPEAKIDLLRRAEGKERRIYMRKLEPVVASFKVGEHVKITDGPFDGFEGIVQKGGEARTFRILTWLFGRATTITLAAGQIESLCAPEPEEDEAEIAA